MLETIGVTFGYRPDAPILSELDISFPEGTVSAITGPSGKGKSTLLYVLGLMLKPLAGEIVVAGEPTSGLRDSARAGLRASTFGFVFQDSALDASRTVLDNVLETTLYRNESRATAARRANALLEEFGVDLRATARPGQVSGGQAQRVALCRALLGNPRILLADEPTGNLDPQTAEVVVGAFQKHASAGNTVVIVTHDPLLARRCDQVIPL